MNRILTSHITMLPEPHILYDPTLESFIRQVATLCVLPGEYREKNDDTSICTIEEAVEKGDLTPLSFPVNEIGVVNPVSLRPFHYRHLGCAGDRIHWTDPAIMHYCQSRFADGIEFQDCFDHTLRYLSRHGIEVDTGKRDVLKLVIHKSEDFVGEYHFRADVSDSISDLPFYHMYEASDYTDYGLYKDIAAMLKSIFDILPPPDRLLFSVDTISGTPRHNSDVLDLLKDAEEFPFRIIPSHHIH